MPTLAALAERIADRVIDSNARLWYEIERIVRIMLEDVLVEDDDGQQCIEIQKEGE